MYLNGYIWIDIDQGPFAYNAHTHIYGIYFIVHFRIKEITQYHENRFAIIWNYHNPPFLKLKNSNLFELF